MATKLVLRNTLLSLAALALALGALGFGFATPAAAAAEAGTAQVDVDLLNLRAGPGFQHLVLRLLERDQELILLGRSRNGVWVEVRLPEGNGGWVYAAFLRTKAALSKLPVTEAAGGPTDPAAPQTTYPLSMTISDNVATVVLQRYPANAEVVVRLSRADGSGSLTVAQGATDANGAAQFTFSMPREWPDGRKVTENALTLTAATADGKFSRTASIQYYR